MLHWYHCNVLTLCILILSPQISLISHKYTHHSSLSGMAISVWCLPEWVYLNYGGTLNKNTLLVHMYMLVSDQINNEFMLTTKNVFKFNVIAFKQLCYYKCFNSAMLFLSGGIPNLDKCRWHIGSLKSHTCIWLTSLCVGHWNWCYLKHLIY